MAEVLVADGAERCGSEIHWTTRGFGTVVTACRRPAGHRGNHHAHAAQSFMSWPQADKDGRFW